MCHLQSVNVIEYDVLWAHDFIYGRLESVCTADSLSAVCICESTIESFHIQTKRVVTSFFCSHITQLINKITSKWAKRQTSKQKQNN